MAPAKGRDENQAWDYVADALYNGIYKGEAQRANFAAHLLKQAFAEGAQKYHADGAHILEFMAVKLMGQEWCLQWLKENVFPKQKVTP